MRLLPNQRADGELQAAGQLQMGLRARRVARTQRGGATHDLLGAHQHREDDGLRGWRVGDRVRDAPDDLILIAEREGREQRLAPKRPEHRVGWV